MCCVLSGVMPVAVKFRNDRVKIQIWGKPVILFFHELCLYITRFAPNFGEKTFAYSHKTAKFAKVFTLESFPLNGTSCVYATCLGESIQRVDCVYIFPRLPSCWRIWEQNLDRTFFSESFDTYLECHRVGLYFFSLGTRPSHAEEEGLVKLRI